MKATSFPVSVKNGLDFNAKPAKCKLCGKVKGVHKANTLNCPTGMKTRIGWTSWHPTQTFAPK